MKIIKDLHWKLLKIAWNTVLKFKYWNDLEVAAVSMH